MGDTINKGSILFTGLVLGGWLFGSSLSSYLSSTRLAARLAASASAQGDVFQIGSELERDGVNTLASGCLGAAVVVAGTFFFLWLTRKREEALAVAAQESQLALLARMSGVLAHELRNPLTSAKGHSQLLVEMLAGSARPQQKAHYVVKEIVRLEALTDKLLVFAKSGQIKREPVNVAELVQTATARVESGESATPVVVRVEGALGAFSLDARAMEQVLVNLLRNAIQAQGDERTPLEVSVSTQDKKLHIAVRDHGPGVPPDVELFTPFATTKLTGTGLGLALCRQVVRAHGGHISLTNHPEGGALVEITLPDEAP
jgi:signal transduction histidine kinase